MKSLHDLAGERKNQSLILCDREGKRRGTASRQECHYGEGRTHLAFMAFVLKDKKVVLTKRGKTKTLWPLAWDASVVSHVLPGETPTEAALRRSGEELGIEVEFKKAGSFFYQISQNDYSENEFCFVLIGKTIENIMVNKVEIGETKMLSRDEYLDFWKKERENFTPWFKIANKKYPMEKMLWK